MAIETEVIRILDSVLRLNGRSAAFRRNTPLLGALPELDSMAVLGIITALEERFAFIIEDDEMDSTVFSTLGSLTDFVADKPSLHPWPPTVHSSRQNAHIHPHLTICPEVT